MEPKCPICGSIIRLFQFNFKEAVYMCPNKLCVYPFGMKNLELKIIQRNHLEMLNSNQTADVSVSSKDTKDQDLLDSLLKEDTNENINITDLEDIDSFLLQLQCNSPPNTKEDDDIDFNSFLNTLKDELKTSRTVEEKSDTNET